MGRPIFDGLQYLEAYGLYRKRMGPTGIQRWLAEKHPDDPASLKTVKNWLKKFAAVKLDDPHLDDEFEWHKMDEHGLPWESSHYLLSMYRFHLRWVGDKPTIRHALWWWRVHQAIPTEGEYDVWAIADHFVIRELANVVMGANLGFGDLQAWLAYQPWTDSRRCTIYIDDVEGGVIPRLSDPDKTYSAKLQLTKKNPPPVGYSVVMHLASIDPRFPHKLPSWWAKDVPIQHVNRTTVEFAEFLANLAGKELGSDVWESSEETRTEEEE